MKANELLKPFNLRELVECDQCGGTCGDKGTGKGMITGSDDGDEDDAPIVERKPSKKGVAEGARTTVSEQAAPHYANKPEYKKALEVLGIGDLIITDEDVKPKDLAVLKAPIQAFHKELMRGLTIINKAQRDLLSTDKLSPAAEGIVERIASNSLQVSAIFNRVGVQIREVMKNLAIDTSIGEGTEAGTPVIEGAVPMATPSEQELAEAAAKMKAKDGRAASSMNEGGTDMELLASLIDAGKGPAKVQGGTIVVVGSNLDEVKGAIAQGYSDLRKRRPKAVTAYGWKHVPGDGQHTVILTPSKGQNAAWNGSSSAS